MKKTMTLDDAVERLRDLLAFDGKKRIRVKMLHGVGLHHMRDQLGKGGETRRIYAATIAALERRGLIERELMADGDVEYVLTHAGQDALRGARKPKAAG